MAESIACVIKAEGTVLAKDPLNAEYSAILRNRQKLSDAKSRSVMEITEEEEKKIHMFQSFKSSNFSRMRSIMVSSQFSCPFTLFRQCRTFVVALGFVLQCFLLLSVTVP